MYWFHPQELWPWLDGAQSSLLFKNRVRKELWSEFVSIMKFTQSPQHTYKMSRIHFTTLQTFLLVDGKGLDRLSDDKLLSICTLFDTLRASVYSSLVEEESKCLTPTRSSVSYPEQQNQNIISSSAVQQPAAATSRPVLSVVTTPSPTHLELH